MIVGQVDWNTAKKVIHIHVMHAMRLLSEACMFIVRYFSSTQEVT